jgi:hypothetical protein
MIATLQAPQPWLQRLSATELDLTWNRTVEELRGRLGKMTPIQLETSLTWVDLLVAEYRKRERRLP